MYVQKTNCNVDI